MNRRQIGRDFEKEAFEILKKQFDKVEWLSEEHPQSTFDFKCFKNGKAYNVDAKFVSAKNVKPQLKTSQKGADYVIFKNGFGEVRLIEKSEFGKLLCFQKEFEYTDEKRPLGEGRHRQVKRYGNSIAINLSPSDMKDFNLKVGDWIDIDDAVKLRSVPDELKKKFNKK